MPKITLDTVAGIPITSRAMGTLKFRPLDMQGRTRVVELYKSYNVPNQPHNLIYVRHLTKQHACAWKSNDFVKCTWADDKGAAFEFSYENREFLDVAPIPDTVIDTVDGAINALAINRSSTMLRSEAVLRPNHPRRKASTSWSTENGRHIPRCPSQQHAADCCLLPC